MDTIDVDYVDDAITFEPVDCGQALIAYIWDASTFVFVGTIPCQLDPLETQQQGKAVWLIPAQSTLAAPEETKSGYVNVWDGAGWGLCENHLGQEYWLPGDKWDAPAKIMENLGPFPAGALLEPPAKPKEVLEKEIERSMVAAIQEHLDAFARTRRYDGIMSACTYATSVLPQFQIEGQYCVEARDSTWAKGYEILDAVLTEKRSIPTVEEVLAELPKLQWPGAS